MDDECATASEIYSCGKEKEPVIVDAMLGISKGNSTVVSFVGNMICKKLNVCS